jgi:hypothetical protein
MGRQDSFGDEENSYKVGQMDFKQRFGLDYLTSSRSATGDSRLTNVVGLLAPGAAHDFLLW